MAELQHITHGIEPTYDEYSSVLVLGTMPSPASRALGFNYGHPRNRFWRVMAHLAGEPVPSTPARMKDFCLRHHIALWDVLAECDIEGASDSSIRNARPNELTRITRSAPIEAVFCTGAKAYELYCKYCEAQTGITAVKLPSTSPANAACSFEKLVAAYAQIFEHEHAFEPPVLEVPQVVELEQTIAAHGTSLAELMDRAGTALAWHVAQVLRELEAGEYAPGRQLKAAACAPQALVTILCGNGNNGGDGWVAAARLAQAGQAVCVVAQKAPEALRAQPAHDAALEALDVLMACGAQLVGPGAEIAVHDDGSLVHMPLVLVEGTSAQFTCLIERAQVVVDAVMGTGSRASRAPFDEWIEATNRFRGTHAVVAADIPSGVFASDGTHAESHIIADETLTMIVRKPGLVAPECGDVRVAPLAHIEPYLS